MSRIAVITGRETGLIFKNIGVDHLEVSTPEEAAALIKEKAGEYGVMFITEDIAVSIQKVMKEYSSSSLPALIEIPSLKGTEGLGRKKMKRITEQAVGADILFQEEEHG